MRVDRLRVAGTAEFNGINHDIRADRIRPLLQWVAQGNHVVMPFTDTEPDATASASEPAAASQTDTSQQEPQSATAQMEDIARLAAV